MVYDSKKKRALTYVGAGVLSIAALVGITKGCSCSPSEEQRSKAAVEERLENIEKLLSQKHDFNAQLDYVINNMHRHPGAADKMAREGLTELDRQGMPYSEQLREQVFNKVYVQAEKNPEMIDLFGPNAQAYARKKWFKQTATDAARSVYGAAKEGVKIISGE
jgi:hypothetical protein